MFWADEKAKRLELKSKMISTVSLCDECRPSPQWLGLFSPKDKIRTSGLWLVNELYKEPLSSTDLEALEAGFAWLPLRHCRSQAEYDFRYSNREKLGVNDVMRAETAIASAPRQAIDISRNSLSETVSGAGLAKLRALLTLLDLDRQGQ